jgi:hypothetical protein
MRRMFAKDGGIFLEDYEFFTRQPLRWLHAFLFPPGKKK